MSHSNKTKSKAEVYMSLATAKLLRFSSVYAAKCDDGGTAGGAAAGMTCGVWLGQSAFLKLPTRHHRP